MFKTNSCLLFKLVGDFSELRVQAQGVTMPKIGLRKLGASFKPKHTRADRQEALELKIRELFLNNDAETQIADRQRLIISQQELARTLEERKERLRTRSRRFQAKLVRAKCSSDKSAAASEDELAPAMHSAMIAAVPTAAAETLLEKLYNFKREAVCLINFPEAHLVRLLSNETVDIHGRIRQLRSDFNSVPLHWRLLCTKVYIRLFLEIALSTAIVIEEMSENGVQKHMVAEKNHFDKVSRQLKWCCYQKNMSSLFDINDDFNPFRSSYDTVEGWKHQTSWIESDGDHFDKISMYMCQNVEMQVKDVVKLKMLLHKNWSMFARIFKSHELELVRDAERYASAAKRA